MEIMTELFEVQGLFATNPEGDSKMDVVEVVPSVCPVSEQLVWMSVWHYIYELHRLSFYLTYICLVAERETSLSITPFLETYELKGYTLVEINYVISEW